MLSTFNTPLVYPVIASMTGIANTVVFVKVTKGRQPGLVNQPYEYDPGFFDNETGRVEPGSNPFVPDKVLPM